ncbi:hypothetical protein NDU88_006277 [Pleurodeles waltl]|uniref:Uncharacterized protein n=1 Tax=Pleurodeles waltl TaxID=8319 RepID=A0AAV7TDG8_PLEWA|nr:hypothetical protein NDU88_006277 [Pleurodeles waltl]
MVVETIPSDTCSETTLMEGNEPLIEAIQGSEDLAGIRDSSTVISEKEWGPLTGKEQLQVQPQGQRSEKQTRVGTTNISSSTLGIEEMQKIPSNPKGWNKVIEKDLKSSDWAKDSSDKFYSLTEDSDLSSGEHSLSESGSSETSETGNKSSSNEPTVRQLRRQQKCTKTRPGPQEGFEIPTSTGGRTLKWDYSSNRLTDTPTTSGQELVNNNMEGKIRGTTSNTCSAGADSGMLQSIYNSIKDLQTETRIESQRARVATKRLQGTVRKVAKTCTEIEAKLCSMDEKIGAVEEDVDALKQQSAARGDQLADVMWKLEDFENRQRRNNLRFLGIPEGLEGGDIRTYMVKLLRVAFPELGTPAPRGTLQHAAPAHRVQRTVRHAATVTGAPDARRDTTSKVANALNWNVEMGKWRTQIMQNVCHVSQAVRDARHLTRKSVLPASKDFTCTRAAATILVQRRPMLKALP